MTEKTPLSELEVKHFNQRLFRTEDVRASIQNILERIRNYREEKNYIPKIIVEKIIKQEVGTLAENHKSADTKPMRLYVEEKLLSSLWLLRELNNKKDEVDFPFIKKKYRSYENDE